MTNRMASHRFAERCRALLPANTAQAPAERLPALAMELTPLKSAPLRRAPALARGFPPCPGG